MRTVTAGMVLLSAAVAAPGPATAASCSRESARTRMPVVELYTSEGCSSCPPADRWLSGLKEAAAAGKVVAQAFHVGYWDHIGWVDRFAAPAHTARQREIARRRGTNTIYTPQLLRDGADSRDYAGVLDARPEPAGARIRLEREGDSAQAQVVPESPGGRWAAYWTVTEHGHASKVKAGENAGEFLQHDFVVRQFVSMGTYRGAHKLALRPLPAAPGHPQQLNVVVFDPADGRTLQALSLQCAGG